MKRAPSLQIRRGGILQLSTWIILAGSTLTLTSCDSSERKARQAQASYEAESKRLIAELDDQRTQLLSGEVPNNFRIDDIGYYHAGAHDFYEHSYNFQRDGKWFVNNTWAEAPGPEDVPASRPSPEALKRIDDALAKQQQSLDTTAQQATYYQNQSHSSGPGLGTALAMYWLLSGNRGSYAPGPGFSSFGQRAPLFETTYRRQRDEQARTASYAGGGSRSGTSGSSGSSHTTYGKGSSSSSSSGDNHSSTSASRPSSPSGSTHASGSSSSPSSRGGFGSSGGGSSSS
ncbi:hypothetical protein KBB96_20295 [Luteolibacter ambystomatis]|uniref:Lipoprotein n=1 Tax=Luteolibacter ambystomatis TaxID=2824561 RepID=A0A975J010_9BACT|nr:hypothetical protein [Luteolibacter ambystomatis]QUE51180.1 hypothetical protein KBB96_20295 [Luteolibacter ambystomatis]